MKQIVFIHSMKRKKMNFFVAMNESQRFLIRRMG